MLFSNIKANDNYIIGQKGYIKIMPNFQMWSIDGNYDISETSFPIMVYYPISRKFNLSLRGNQANIAGDVNTLSGLSDTQLSCSYHLESAHLVFNVGLNLPSGKKELTDDEFSTSSQIAYSYFNFQVPGFGQGFNVSPGISWAAPISDKLVLGLGATYQLKGGFKPLAGMTDDYDPGDEILLTAGFDIKLAPTTTFATDFIYTIYSEDKIANRTVFDSGDKMMVSCQLRSYQKFNELFLLGRYRSKGKNSYDIFGIFQEEDMKTTPNHLEIIGYYRIMINPQFYISILGEARKFFKVETIPTNAGFMGILNSLEPSIMGFGLSPEYSPTRNLKIPFRVKYFVGDFAGGTKINGIEVGLGISYLF